MRQTEPSVEDPAVPSALPTPPVSSTETSDAPINPPVKSSFSKTRSPNAPSPSAETLLTWTTPEFVAHERTIAWYIILVVIVGLFIGGSIYFKSPMAAILFALIGLLVFLYATRKPMTLNVRITEEGVVVNDSLTPYSQIRSFWVFNEPDFQELSIQTSRPMMPSVRILLGGTDPDVVRDVLLDHLREVEQEEPLSDALARLLKF